MTFRVYPLHFEFRAHDPVLFPPGMSGNVLRGAFGTIFRKLACLPGCTGAKTCERRRVCAYARVFEPSAAGEGPSGLADRPRPFVFRAGHLEGVAVRPGEPFHFDVHVFEMNLPVVPYFVLAFARLGEEGFGPRRGRADLEAVYQMGPAGERTRLLYDAAAQRVQEPGRPVDLPLTPGGEPVRRLSVRFLTPTELKAGSAVVERPEFAALFARARDRVSTLRALYQDSPLEIDFRGLGRLAAAVAMTRCEVVWHEATRYSTRTRRAHPMGGFAGEAEYEGELSAFLPILKAAEWTGVGRHAVWGRGAITVTPA